MRKWWLDNAKAFAIFLVVFAHCITETNGNVILDGTVSAIYGFHMPLFFMLSGYSFYLLVKKDGTLKNLIKHLLKIVVYYLVFSMIYIILNMIMSKFIFVHTEINYTDILYLWYKPVAHYWYLYVLAIIYVIKIAKVSLLDDKKVKPAILSIIITGALLIASPLLRDIWQLSRIMKMLFFFELGYYAEWWMRKLVFYITPVIGILCGYYIVAGYNYGTVDTYIEMIYAISISMFVICLFSNRLINRIKYFTYIGTTCVWIYVLHSYCTSLMSNICKRLIGAEYIYTRIILSTIAGMVIPIICVNVINFSLKRIRGKQVN